MEERLSRTDYESQLVGLFLLDPMALDTAIREGFRPEFVYQRTTRAVAEAVWKLHHERKMVDAISVAKQIEIDNPGIDDATTQIFYVQDSALVSREFVSHHVEILKDLYLKREIRRIARAHLDSLDEDLTAEQVSSNLMFDISRIAGESQDGYDHDTVVRQIMGQIRGGTNLTIPTSFPMLRRKIRGYVRGVPSIVAARPGKGKSTFMINEMLWQSIQGYRVGCISLEMPVDQVLRSMACHSLRMSWFRLENGSYSAEQERELERALYELKDLPLVITDKGMTIQQVSAWIKSMKAHENLDIVYLDYVQIIRPDNTKKPDHEVVREQSNALREVAKETGVALVELCQLNRDAAEPQGPVKPEELSRHLPKIHHLRNSGSLEQDAYMVTLLSPNYAAPFFDSNENHVNYLAIVDKHRGGPTGNVPMVYYKDQHTLWTPSMPGEPAYHPRNQPGYCPIRHEPTLENSTSSDELEECPF